jgi:hypothetical protein
MEEGPMRIVANIISLYVPFEGKKTTFTGRLIGRFCYGMIRVIGDEV